MENTNITISDEKLSFESFRNEILKDYRLCCESREASLLGRKEVLTGKAKFGIFGDGKELPQIAAAKFFKNGDFLSGYYRDQTFAFATGQATIEEFFSQLYADTDPSHDPHSGGRQMNSHFASPLVDENGNWRNLTEQKNIAAGLAPTAGQMPRALGLALASKLYRNNPALHEFRNFSRNGDEICFCTIGDASTSEGHFWETINSAGVLQVPLAVFVWDDGYGISVPTSLQTTKGSISQALQGLKKQAGTNGIDIYTVKGWDYAGMCEVFEAGIRKIRETHIPAVFHVQEVTQPQGHSTSGSHERYKTPERLEWERNWDGNRKFREWILENALASEEELNEIELQARDFVKESRNRAWSKYLAPIKEIVSRAETLINNIPLEETGKEAEILKLKNDLVGNREPQVRDVLKTLHQVVHYAGNIRGTEALKAYFEELNAKGEEVFGKYLYSEHKSPLSITGNSAEYGDETVLVNGYEILNRYFDQLFDKDPRVVAFGEDVGKIGDVNQGFSGLQQKYGDIRIFDTGIRELTIMGQAIGLAMRGLRPIAEIQYIDYLLYGLQPLSDDAATLHWRSVGRQIVPLIVRTRGHRLEGIWHSGSPMGLMLSSLRGMHICVPRNMVQAVGMYNTLLQGNDPAIVVECLNGYRLKERLPLNLADFQVPLGIPEVIREGSDITIVSYGSVLRVIEEAANALEQQGVSVEIIDVQTLLPFDRNGMILESLKKTNRILFVDEDVPGGAAAYMFNIVMEKQGGYRWLDAAPATLTGKAHRPSYGSDGDYFSKPNAEQVYDTVMKMMKE